MMKRKKLTEVRTYWVLRWTYRINPHPLSKEHLLCGVFYRTRKAARNAVTEHWGYIKDRKDLHRAPFHWMMPVPVKVQVRIKEV
jgi:hypothetical protein